MNNAKMRCKVNKFVLNAVKMTMFTTCNTAVHKIEEVRYRPLTLYTWTELSCKMREPTDRHS